MSIDYQKLGKLIIEEFSIENRSDMITRWMAFYIAQQIESANENIGQAKDDAEKKCFDAILELWNKRTKWPHEMNPFNDIGLILQLIEKLNPENDDFYYFTSEFPKSDNKEINYIFEVIKNIDKVARIWICFLLKKATNMTLNKELIEWISASMPYSEENKGEIDIIDKLLENNNDDECDFIEEVVIDKRIKELEKFKEINQQLIEMYRSEIKK